MNPSPRVTGMAADPAPVAAAPHSTSRNLMRRSVNVGSHYGVVILLVLVVIFFSLFGKTSSVYLSHQNLTTLIGNQAVVLTVALAVLVPLGAGYIDLSAGAITGVSSLVPAGAISRFGISLPIAILLGILAGVLLGAVNGYLIARLELSSIVTTLGTSTVLSGLMVWYTNGETISKGIPRGFTDFGSLSWLGIPRVTYVMVPIVLLVWYLLENTPFGRHLQAIASNPRAARLVGLGVKSDVQGAFLLSGFLAGVGGILLLARSGGADSTTGPSYMFPALAAVFLGATTIHPGRPNIWGAVVGIFFVAFMVSGLSLLGASSWAPNVFNGAILVAAAFLATAFARRRGGGPRMF